MRLHNQAGHAPTCIAAVQYRHTCSGVPVSSSLKRARSVLSSPNRRLALFFSLWPSSTTSTLHCSLERAEDSRSTVSYL